MDYVAPRKSKSLRRTAPVRRKDVRKEESMRIRVSGPDKELLERAAAVLGLGVSGFVLSAAMERARKLLEQGSGA